MFWPVSLRLTVLLVACFFAGYSMSRQSTICMIVFVIVGPNGLPSSASHLFVGYVVYVGDTEELSKACHLDGLYPSLCVGC